MRKIDMSLTGEYGKCQVYNNDDILNDTIIIKLFNSNNYMKYNITINDYNGFRSIAMIVYEFLENNNILLFEPNRIKVKGEANKYVSLFNELYYLVKYGETYEKK